MTVAPAIIKCAAGATPKASTTSPVSSSNESRSRGQPAAQRQRLDRVEIGDPSHELPDPGGAQRLRVQRQDSVHHARPQDGARLDRQLSRRPRRRQASGGERANQRGQSQSRCGTATDGLRAGQRPERNQQTQLHHISSQRAGREANDAATTQCARHGRPRRREPRPFGQPIGAGSGGQQRGGHRAGAGRLQIRARDRRGDIVTHPRLAGRPQPRGQRGCVALDHAAARRQQPHARSRVAHDRQQHAGPRPRAQHRRGRNPPAGLQVRRDRRVHDLEPLRRTQAVNPRGDGQRVRQLGARRPAASRSPRTRRRPSRRLVDDAPVFDSPAAPAQDPTRRRREPAARRRPARCTASRGARAVCRARPSSTTRPPSTTSTRGKSAVSAMSWVTQRSVASRQRFRARCMSTLRRSRGNPRNGSSRMTSRGDGRASARAKRTRCPSPPDTSPPASPSARLRRIGQPRRDGAQVGLVQQRVDRRRRRPSTHRRSRTSGSRPANGSTGRPTDPPTPCAGAAPGSSRRPAARRRRAPRPRPPGASPAAGRPGWTCPPPTGRRSRRARRARTPGRRPARSRGRPRPPGHRTAGCGRRPRRPAARAAGSRAAGSSGAPSGSSSRNVRLRCAGSCWTALDSSCPSAGSDSAQ